MKRAIRAASARSHASTCRTAIRKHMPGAGLGRISPTRAGAQGVASRSRSTAQGRCRAEALNPPSDAIRCSLPFRPNTGPSSAPATRTSLLSTASSVGPSTAPDRYVTLVDEEWELLSALGLGVGNHRIGHWYAPG
jgi:hypothetical protein